MSVAVITGLVLLTTTLPAQAKYPGALGTPTTYSAGKPLWGTLQNVPGMGATEFTYVGPTMGSTIEAYYA